MIVKAKHMDTVRRDTFIEVTRSNGSKVKGSLSSVDIEGDVELAMFVEGGPRLFILDPDEEVKVFAGGFFTTEIEAVQFNDDPDNIQDIKDFLGSKCNRVVNAMGMLQMVSLGLRAYETDWIAMKEDRIAVISNDVFEMLFL